MQRILTLITVLSAFVSYSNAQITSFTDYQYEEHPVFMLEDSDPIGHLQQLDIEFPMDMEDKKVLAKIQQQLIDTLLHDHFHTTQLDVAMAKYWNIEPDKIKRKSVYPSILQNDADEYFDYNGVHNIHFEHLCGRTSYNQNGLYIMRHHYTWYDYGSHHYPSTQYFAFDTRTGKMVHFLDIFSEYHWDNKRLTIYDISYYIQEALSRKFPEISLQHWMDASFTITQTSLVLHYTHDTLGCWADGEQEVEIPLNTAKLFLNPDWKHLFE